MAERTLGAYVLPGDPVWLARTLPQYYSMLTALSVPVPADGLSWTGRPLPVDETLAIIDACDTRGLADRFEGRWTNVDRPRDAGTAQRQAALNRVGDGVDWVLQIDNDELLPHPEVLGSVLDEADRVGAIAVEWPMRVLYRRTRRTVLEVVASNGAPVYDYPGPIAVRPGATLTEARRAAGPLLRVAVHGDDQSLQITRPAEPQEFRATLLQPEHAILHNSWARHPRDVWRKVTSSGHSRDFGLARYYVTRWLSSPLTWRAQRDVHPFSSGLWPALAPRENAGVYAD
ncbi:hypothetical protein [Demequina aestuarii]|uniref:hypothetical protein n=1 Tax=Demequina aestuarii TaxID=327095 RepID=UPI0007842243|nr:hypothetical protein [Demequina aestuarii]